MESVYPYGQRYNVDNNTSRAKPRITYDSNAVATVLSTDQYYQPAQWDTTLITKVIQESDDPLLHLYNLHVFQQVTQSHLIIDSMNRGRKNVKVT